MFKKGLLLTIIFLLIFCITGFASDYTYTQESGAGFFVSTADKSDALEDSNELRQIVNDLGTLLGHSKMDGLYPKDLTTGGYLGRLNFGLDTSKPVVPVVNDMYLATDTVKVYRCFTAGNWVEVYPSTIENNVIKTGAFTAGKIVKINNATGIIEQGTNTDTDVADAVTKKHSQNTDTDLDATFEATFIKKADAVNVLSDITSAGADIEDAVTKKHAQNADTALGTQTQDLDMGTHKIVNVVEPVAPQDAATKNYADSHCELSMDQSPMLADDLDLNCQNIKIYTNLDLDHSYSGLTDVYPVGESVVYGDLLYFDWTDKEWKKTDADAATTMPGLRIALEDKIDGQNCIMLVMGYIRDDDWNFTGAMVYASVTP